MEQASSQAPRKGDWSQTARFLQALANAVEFRRADAVSRSGTGRHQHFPSLPPRQHHVSPPLHREKLEKTLKDKVWRLPLNMVQEGEKQVGETPVVSPEEHRARMKEYVERWARVGPLLEAQREEDVRRSDTISNISAFNRLYEMALAASPPVPDSGLVEQQRLFSKLR